MLSVYPYSNVTNINSLTDKYHKVRNINAKISIAISSLEAVPRTGNILLSFDKEAPLTWFITNSYTTKSITAPVNNNSYLSSFYLLPGITHIAVCPDSGIITFQIIEYYEPGTQ